MHLFLQNTSAGCFCLFSNSSAEKKNTCKLLCRTCLPQINQIRSDLQVLKTYLNVSNVKLKQQQQQQKRNTITSTFIFMWWWVSSRPEVICKKSLRPATWPVTWLKKRDSCLGVSLWILWIFLRTSFLTEHVW